uniref:Tyrosine specific protein phosphatases domain-containing protein n=1 Tax=Globodera rostochiensis TaxID=31243 RepID=A0A914GS34_GLORO
MSHSHLITQNHGICAEYGTESHHSHRLRQESVLVHCLAGVSRSVCLCLAYLMTVTNLDYPNALDFVGRRHYCAKPNFGFKMQLIKFGQQFVQRERQRLFAEFGHCTDQLQELFRNDCIFTNSLFVCGTSTTLGNAFAVADRQERPPPPQTEEGRRPDDGTSGSSNSTSNPTETGDGTAQQQMPMPFMDDEFEADDLHRKCTAADSCC